MLHSHAMPSRCRFGHRDPARHRLARVVRRADPCRDRRNGQPIVSEVSRLCLETLSRCASGETQRTSRPPTPAQPKHQIPIRRALHTAGSFLGDFPTPNGVRNSSRERTGGFGQSKCRSGHSLQQSVVATLDPWRSLFGGLACPGTGHSARSCAVAHAPISAAEVS